MRTRTVLTAAVGALALSATTPAWAYWTNTGTGTATATALALGTPHVVGTGLLLVATFKVNTAPAGVTPTGYTVFEGATNICNITGSTGQCSSLALTVLGGITFQISAVLAGSLWTSLTPESCTYNALGLTATCTPA